MALLDLSLTSCAREKVFGQIRTRELLREDGNLVYTLALAVNAPTFALESAGVIFQ